MPIVSRLGRRSDAVPIVKGRKVVPVDHRPAGTDELTPLERELAKTVDRGFDLVPDNAYLKMIDTRDAQVYRDTVYKSLSMVRDDIERLLLEQLNGTGLMSTDGLKADLLRHYRQLTKADTPEGAIGSLSFDVTNPRARTWASTEAGRLITNMADEQRDVMRDVINTSMSSNQTRQQMSTSLRTALETIEPGTGDGKSVARMIGANVNGLTRQSERAVFNTAQRVAQDMADRGITGAKAIEKVRSETQRHADRLRRSRSRTIARTEMAFAAEAGRQESWDQAADKGLIDKASSVKVWSASPMDVCAICTRLQGSRQPLNGQWDTGRGKVKHPPAHPNCRCTMVLVTDPKQMPKPVGTGQPEDPFRLDNTDVKVPTPDDFPPLPGTEVTPPPPTPTPSTQPPSPQINPHQQLSQRQYLDLVERQRQAGMTVELRPELESAIVDYTNGSGTYSEINTSLRDPDWFDGLSTRRQEKVSGYIRDLDRAIADSPPLDRRVMVYRGVKDEGLDVYAGLQVGDEVTEAGFASTSVNRETAETFARVRGANRQQGLVLEIELPEGTRLTSPLGYRTGDTTILAGGGYNEAELLLQRGTRFEVVARDGNMIRLRVIAQEPPPVFGVPPVPEPVIGLHPTMFDDLRPAISALDDVPVGIDFDAPGVTQAHKLPPNQTGKKAVDACVEAGRRVEERVAQLLSEAGVDTSRFLTPDQLMELDKRHIELMSRADRELTEALRDTVRGMGLPEWPEDKDTYSYVVQHLMPEVRRNPAKYGDIFAAADVDSPSRATSQLKQLLREALRGDVISVEGQTVSITGNGMSAYKETQRLIDEIDTTIKTARRQLDEFYALERDALRQALREARPDYGTGSFIPESGLRANDRAIEAGIEQQLADAASDLPREWVHNVRDQDYRYVLSGRGHHSKWEREIATRSGKGGSSTTLHEVTHAAESHTSRLAKVNQAFYAESIEGEKVRLLSTALPGHGYSKDERFFEDEFGDYYAGKWYGGSTKGGWGVYPNGSFETLTRGVESLFRRDVMTTRFILSGRYRQYVLGCLVMI